MDDEDAGEERGCELTPRAPEERDLVALCQRLNELDARYVVIGGFAVIYGLYPRTTVDIDLLVDTAPANEALIYKALEVFPDKAVRELKPGEISQYTVVRVADEVVVDLMKSACGIEYAEAAKEIVIREVQGVPIPFASPRLLWRTKKPTRRAKDAGDLIFLEQYFAERGEEPPAI
ncbi:MAG: hypothetical protein ABJB09_04670 [Verrucomicrobiota bacterium]